MEYLQPQSFGSVLRNSFGIYFRHWTTVVATTATLTAPFGLLRLYASNSVGGSLLAIAYVFEFMAGYCVALPLTVAISDICIGVKPSVPRSYQRAFKNPGRVLGTILPFSLLSLVATLALIIPGFIVGTLYMFVAPVVILEQLGGRAAFKRSRELGRGHYLRNLGVAVVAYLIVGLLLGLPAGFLTAVVGDATAQVLMLPISICLIPLILMPGILLYYDMRSRKEDYGAPQLAEDLKY
jgi:hypothetical protein